MKSVILSRLAAIAILAAAGVAAAPEDGDASGGAAGVTIRVETGAWPADEPLEEGVTPVRVTVENRSDRSVRLRYRELLLVGASGSRYAALPLHDVLLTGREPEGNPEPKLSITSPKFGQLSFRIAPGYREIFPGSETFPSHFGEDREYTEYHSRHWRADRKPTLEMFERMLPEGVLGPGGYVAGFLYFEAVDPWEPRLRLEARLVDAESGEDLGEVTVYPDGRKEP